MKKIICLLVIILNCFFITSCSNSSNVYDNTDYFTEEGKLTVSVRLAFYNNGKEIPGLAELDPELEIEGVKDDGGLSVYFAACNNSKYDRKLTDIAVNYIRNKDNYDIVEPCEFSFDNEVYIASGQTIFIPCVFEKDFVKLEARLDGIVSETALTYEGCVINGDEPEEKANSITYSIKEAKFTSSDGIEGSFAIKNNFKTDKKINQISFMIYTDEGKTVTKSPVKMDVDATIASGESIVLKYAVIPDNVAEKIKENKLFNSLKIKVTEE